uniref:SFRICE_015481 n=1 Tax=Spodoptera frugiperda TaxID=7108 RepID=A0A2H1WG50_SPOFR
MLCQIDSAMLSITTVCFFLLTRCRYCRVSVHRPALYASYAFRMKLSVRIACRHCRRTVRTVRMCFLQDKLKSVACDASDTYDAGLWTLTKPEI